MVQAGNEKRDALFSKDNKTNTARNDVQDEEEVALHWAYATLKNEYNRRIDIRDQNEKVTNQKVKAANIKIKSLYKFKKLEAENKLKLKKLEKENKTLETLNSQKLEDKTSSLNESLKNANEKKIEKLEGDHGQNESKDETASETKNKQPSKGKVEIIRIQDSLKYKRKSTLNSADISKSDEPRRYKTDKERIEAAQKVLLYLTEKKKEQNKGGSVSDENEPEDGANQLPQNDENNAGARKSMSRDGEPHDIDKMCKQNNFRLFMYSPLKIHFYPLNIIWRTICLKIHEMNFRFIS